MIVSDELAARLAKIELLVCDVDGTLTDGTMWYGPEGEVARRFHTRDGHGLRLLSASGVYVAFVTGEDSPIVTARATKLGVQHVVLGCEDKRAAVVELQAALDVDRESTAMIGDDLGDLAGFEQAAVCVAVADAVPEVRQAADLICSLPGGAGAVRELCDAILATRAAQSPWSRGDERT